MMNPKNGLPLVNHLLQHTLRSLCAEDQWVYSVFWRILPRNYPPPKWDSEAGPFDRSKGNKRNWILVWEDGFCNFAACCGDAAKESQRTKANLGEEETPATLQPELFFKMSHDIYNYGEGLMGKVAADNSHKWIYRDPSEHDIAFLNAWQGSLDSHPRTWEAQFRAGIQTIAVVSVGEGLLQLGSTEKIVEDLNFVISLQRKFNYLQSIPGVFAPHPMQEILSGSSRSGSRGREEDNAGDQELEGSRPMLAMEEQLMHRNTEASCVNRKPVFVSDQSQMLGVKRPLADSDSKVPSCYKLPATFPSSPSQQQPSSNRLLDLSPPLKASTLESNGLASYNSPSHSRNPRPVLPSMSSLQALLSKLPAVTASDHCAAPPYIQSSVSLNRSAGPLVRSFADASSIISITSKMPKTTAVPDTTAAYAVSCTTKGAGNCTGEDMQTLQSGRPVAGVRSGIAASMSTMPEAEAANWSHLSEFTVPDDLEAGEAYNSLFGEIIS